MKKIIKTLLNDVLVPLVRKIKLYTGIETPLYKLWWDWNCNDIQRRLDIQHNKIK